MCNGRSLECLIDPKSFFHMLLYAKGKKMKKISKIITKTSVTVNFDGKTFTFENKNPKEAEYGCKTN